MPKLTVIIGANGAGKTTWRDANEHRLQTPFYNADSIAAALGDANDPDLQIEARTAVDRMIEARLAAGDSFGFESTYAGRSRPAIVRRAHSLGYETEALFLGTEQVEINLQRVRQRFEAGGHDIPRDEIIRRWTAVRDNLIATWKVLDVANLVDTSLPRARFLAAKKDGEFHLFMPEDVLPTWFLPVMQRVLETSAS